MRRRVTPLRTATAQHRGGATVVTQDGQLGPWLGFDPQEQKLTSGDPSVAGLSCQLVAASLPANFYQPQVERKSVNSFFSESPSSVMEDDDNTGEKGSLTVLSCMLRLLERGGKLAGW